MFRNRIMPWILIIVMIFSLGAPALATGSDEMLLENIPEAESNEAAATTETEISAEASFRACAHLYSYKLQNDSYEATDTTGGYRHYICTECGAEYSYETDPLVYTEHPVTGEPVNHNGASNPVLPGWEHIPDGEPHVFWSRADEEWRVYLYGSHDVSGTSFCGKNYVLWSAPVYDMSEWRYDGMILDISEINPNGAMNLFAPDAGYDLITDTYYLISNEAFSKAVLRGADNPAGPWDVEESIWELPIAKCYDPALYIEDGTIYVAGSCMPRGFANEDINAAVQRDGYTSGMGHIAVIYQLKADPSDGDGIESITWCPTDEREYLPIYEGPSLTGYVEELGVYVLLYVSYEVGDDGTWYNSTISYVYTDNLMNGTWHYGNNEVDGDIIGYNPNVLISGDHGNVISDTSGRYHRNLETGEIEFRGMPTYTFGNNHGGMAEINGEWYFFGHRQTNRHSYSRQAVAGQIGMYYDEENDLPVIKPMEFTSSGVADSLDAYRVWSADVTTYLIEGIDIPAAARENNNPTSGTTTDPYILATRDKDATHATPIVNITDGNVIGYKYLDFGDDETVVKLNLLVTKDDGYIDGSATVLIDAPTVSGGGTVIGSIDITSAAVTAATESDTATDGTVWSWISDEMDEAVSGVHAVYLVLDGEDEEGVICKLDEFSFTALRSANEHSYKLDLDTYVESTETTGGFRRYVCEYCGDEYSYETDPMVYEINPKTGEPVDHAGTANPYLPGWEHTPDGEPHVFWSTEDEEWRVYVYGSHDTDDALYCGKDYVVWSAPVYDMSDWRYEGISFEARDEVRKLFAPDVAYDVYTDSYYMITFEMFGQGSWLYVADSPAGPWDNQDRLYRFPANDPAIYIEEGTIYLVGVTGSSSLPDEIRRQVQEAGYASGVEFAVIYQMKEDLSGPEAISWCPIEDGDPYIPLYEGISIRYLEDYGLYVLVFVTQEIGGVDEKGDEIIIFSTLGYAFSDDIMGEWKYGDNGVDGDIIKTDLAIGGNQGNVISDTSGRYSRDPATGEMVFNNLPTYPYNNNHGGLEKINGEWYFFGHRHTGVTTNARQSVIGQIDMSYDEDEDMLYITPMEYTSSGAADSLDAFETWPAYVTCYLVEGLGIPTTSPSKIVSAPYIQRNRIEELTHASPIVNISDGNVIGYKYLDFGDSQTTVALNLLVAKADGYVDGSATVMIDAPSVEKGGTAIGSIDITAAALDAAERTETATDGTIWSWISSEMDIKVSGIHAVYFVLDGADEDSVICKLDEFSFTALASEDPVDKSMLENLVNEYQALEQGDYTDESWSEFQKALEEARKLLADEAATQDQVNASAENLRNVRANLTAVEKESYTITASAYQGGTVDETTEVAAGENAEIKIKADEGSKLAAILVDGVTVDISRIKDDIYTVENVRKDMVLRALFVKDQSEDFAAKFSDVPKKTAKGDDTWYYNAVDMLVGLNIIEGTTSTTYEPENDMKRSEFTKLIYEMAMALGIEVEQDKSIPFTDMPTDKYWATGYIGWAYKNELVKGYDGKRFGPEDSITRQDMAVILERFFDKFLAYELPGDKTANFTDAAKISPYAKDAVDYAVRTGLMQGHDTGAFGPTETTLRSQVAQVLYNYLIF